MSNNKFIPKGKHSISFWVQGITLKSEFQWIVRFYNNCIYDLQNSDNEDINKLCGVCTKKLHHIQSARFGWRCRGNQIEITTYQYENKVRIPETVLGLVDVDEPFNLKLFIKDDVFIWYMKTSKFEKTVTTPKTKSWKLKYLLAFYFGGTSVAPHDMDCYINRTK